MYCHNNIKQSLNSLHLLIQLQASWFPENVALQFSFFNKGSDHSCRISLNLLHMFRKCLITLSISTSLGSRKLYRSCIQRIMVIILHPYKTLLCPLSDLWLSLFVQFVPHMNGASSLDTNPAMLFRGTRTRLRTNQ